MWDDAINHILLVEINKSLINLGFIYFYLHWGGRYQPSLEMPLRHMAKVCTITLNKHMLKENGVASYHLQSCHTPYLHCDA